jgi:hypothetical protein
MSVLNLAADEAPQRADAVKAINTSNVDLLSFFIAYRARLSQSADPIIEAIKLLTE